MVDSLEVKPTLMAFCMRVYSQVKIVLVFANPEGQVKVSTLKISNKLYIALLTQLFLLFFDS